MHVLIYTPSTGVRERVTHEVDNIGINQVNTSPRPPVKQPWRIWEIKSTRNSSYDPSIYIMEFTASRRYAALLFLSYNGDDELWKYA